VDKFVRKIGSTNPRRPAIQPTPEQTNAGRVRLLHADFSQGILLLHTGACSAVRPYMPNHAVNGMARNLQKIVNPVELKFVCLYMTDMYK
jgi:hypothetical protein